MSSCGRSICCSIFASTTPGTVDATALILLPMVNSLVRSSPKSFMAICASVPESMASIRCEIGWPISMLTPGRCDSLWRRSLTISLRERPWSRVYGASISLTFTPRECSSSSARPVLRATVRISGMDSIIFSASRPSWSLFSSDMPGRVLTLIVSEPSLNGGRKLRPRVKNSPIHTRNSTDTPISIGLICENDLARTA